MATATLTIKQGTQTFELTRKGPLSRVYVCTGHTPVSRGPSPVVGISFFAGDNPCMWQIEGAHRGIQRQLNFKHFGGDNA